MRVFLLISLLLSVTVSAEFKSVLFKAPVLEVEDALTESSWKKNWKAAMGKWYWKNDAIVGEENLAQNHHAGAGHIHTMHSGIIEAEFRMDDSKRIQVGHDYLAKDRKDHLLRIIVTSSGKLSVRAGSGWGKTTKMKQVGKGTKVSVEKGKWHKVAFEFDKQKVIVHFDGKKVFEGVCEANQDVVKNRIALTAKGFASFRNVKFWNGVSK
ncbi:MAG: hypothetical protein NE334_21240 [Lentisphaeraceae bacterium]|nr:hypothetical protein [Lentisphaeraceae bacterium]